MCRLKATLQRVQRLTQGFTDGLLSLFPQRADALGAALGIQAERIQVCVAAMCHMCLHSDQSSSHAFMMASVLLAPDHQD